VPDSTVAPAPTQSTGLRAVMTGWREAFSSAPDFRRISINTLIHGMGLWMIGPVYILYFVRTLGAEEGWLGLNATLANLTPILGYYLWQRGVVRWGENRVLRPTIAVIGLYPVLVGLMPGLTPILILTALQGLIAPGINLSHYPMLLKVCPEGQRPMFLALYTTVMNIGAFIMPLIGVKLAGVFGPAPVIIAGGIICLLGSSSFIWNPLRTPDSLALRHAELAGD
jgi:MFS family permease